MTPELTVLVLAVLLAVAQLFLFAVPANLQIGSKYLAGPRDEGVKLQGRAARLQRAFQNHVEGLALFTPAALVVSVSGQSTAFTAACAWAYLLARVAYVPAYAYAWAPWRSAIWAVGLFATVFMLIAALI